MSAIILMAHVLMSVSTQKVVITVSVLWDILYILIIIIVKVGYVAVAK